MDCLKTFGAWAIFICSPPLMLALLGDPQKTVDVKGSVLFFVPFLLIPAVGSILLWLPNLRLDTTNKAMLVGILFGLTAPLLVGFIYMRMFPRFENQIGIFVSVLFTAGFNRSRRRRGWMVAISP